MVFILLTLTVITGVVDAVTYLGLGHVFAANMTGNIALLGFSLAGITDISVTASLISLAAFLLGAAGGGILARSLESNRRRWFLITLTLETIGLSLAAASAAAALSTYVIVALLAMAMGMRSATVRRLGIPDLPTTVLTMTLAALASDFTLNAETWPAARRRIASVVAVLAGAIAGALLLNLGLAVPLVAAAGVLSVTTAAFATAGRIPSVSRPQVPEQLTQPR